jgi:hypothetical protein
VVSGQNYQGVGSTFNPWKGAGQWLMIHFRGPELAKRATNCLTYSCTYVDIFFLFRNHVRWKICTHTPKPQENCGVTLLQIMLEKLSDADFAWWLSCGIESVFRDNFHHGGFNGFSGTPVLVLFG